MGGLFSTAGPPLVYHFYRLPLPYRTIRETLVAVFAINAIFRPVLVVESGDWPAHALTWVLAGLRWMKAKLWIVPANLMQHLCWADDGCFACFVVHDAWCATCADASADPKLQQKYLKGP
jgi:hypothetical protein